MNVLFPSPIDVGSHNAPLFRGTEFSLTLVPLSNRCEISQSTIVGCWERVWANLGNDCGFISKEYISIGTRPFREVQSKVMKVYAQSRQYHTIVEIHDV